MNQSINPFARLEFILALKDVSEFKSSDEHDRAVHVEIELFDYLYVELEIGSDTSIWLQTKELLGINPKQDRVCRDIGEIISRYFCDRKSSSREKIYEILDDVELKSNAEALWKDMIACGARLAF